MINNTELVTRLQELTTLKTLYVLGGFGIRLDKEGKSISINQYSYNKERQAIINGVDSETFGFDCSGMIKGVLWGFDGSNSTRYGGANYASNGVPDFNTAGIWSVCKDRVIGNMDADTITKGEYLYMDGHCGIYAGDGNVIECTPLYQNKVQVTKLEWRKWLGHGKLPWVLYETPTTINDTALKSALIELKSVVDKVMELL